MSKVEAVIFDMDGVIVDSEARHEQAFLEVVEEIGYADRLEMEVRNYTGRSDREMWHDFVAVHRPPHSAEELLAMKRGRVLALIRAERPLFDGVPELVARLADRYPLAVASGSERLVVEEVLSLQGLGRFFSTVVADNEAPRGKPAPDIFLRAAELLGMPPDRCCVIEDSRPGVAAALAAGMPVIAITNSHPAAELAAATWVVETYREIDRLLLG